MSPVCTAKKTPTFDSPSWRANPLKRKNRLLQFPK